MEAGLLFIALWGAIIKTKSTDNIMNRKRKADAEPCLEYVLLWQCASVPIGTQIF